MEKNLSLRKTHRRMLGRWQSRKHWTLTRPAQLHRQMCLKESPGILQSTSACRSLGLLLRPTCAVCGWCWSISNLSLVVVTHSPLPSQGAGSYACVPRDVCLHIWEPEYRSMLSSKYEREVGVCVWGEMASCATVVDCGSCPERCGWKWEDPWLL